MAEQTVKQPTKTNLFRFFVRLQNPLMLWLLRSPLHGIVSQKYLLITFTGRKSGKQYTTPVQYHLANDTLFVITSRDYRWWRNLQGGVPVALRMRGKMVQAKADVTTSPEAVERIARLIHPRLKEAQLARFLPNMTAITILLEGAR